MTRVQILGMESVSEEPKISQTIKENPYSQNVELEGAGKGRKGEVVIRPDLSAIHNVVGKRHYAGGVKTWLPEGSFVISDYPDLAFNKEDHEMMELKEGRSFKKGDNTPSEVLRRNIDVKHYNKMSHTLTDKNKDAISKKTAELMLGKYTETLGKIAFKQEEKKGFPNGVPDFAQGTAPVYDSSVKEDLKEDKQYMKYGGRTLSKFQFAGLVQDENQKRKNAYINWSRTASPTLGTGFAINVNATYPDFSKGNLPGVNGDYEQSLWVPNKPSFSFGRTGNLLNPKFNYNPENNPNTVPQQEEDVPSVTNTPPVRKDMPWSFSPWQKLSMLQGWNNYANIERLMPMRSNIVSPLVELEKTVEPSYLGELASGFRANQVMNPYLAGNNNNQMYGQMLNADRQSKANFINQNVQIANQQNLMNNQTQKQDLAANIGADQQYYQQSVEGRKNFNNARDVVRETNNNEFKGNVEMNQQLAMKLAQMGPNSPWGYDFKTGQFYITGKGDMNASNGSIGPLDTLLSDLQGDMKNMSVTDRINFAKILMGNKVMPYLQQQSQRGMKQGGTFNPYR